jgi:phage-related minor tail protein
MMAGNNIKGITVEINGETGPLDKALKGVNQTSRDLQKELREVEKGLKLDPGNTVLLAQKQELLAKSIMNTKDKLGTLKIAEEQAQRQFSQGRISEEQYRALQREVINTEQSLHRLETQSMQTNAVLSSDQATGNLKNMAKAAGVAAVAVGAAFVGMGIAAMNNADELQRQADVTGLSAERLQELQYAGNNLGVELDVITGAQAKLTKSMDAAKEGTGAQAEAFKTLGINVLDGNGHLKNAKDVMGEAFTALNKVGNETERDALSMKLFGKSAMEMNPLIKAGGDELKKLTDEAKKNGAVMSNEAVAGLDLFGDTMDNIKNSVLGSVGEKLAGLMPKLQSILDKMMELPKFIQDNSTLLTIIGVVIGTITLLIIAFNIQQALLAKGLTLWTWAAGLGTTATTALGTAMTFLTSPIALVILAIVAIIAIFVLAYKNIEGFRNIVDKSWAFIQAKTKEVFEGYIMPFIRDQLMPLFKKVFNTIGDVVKGTFALMGWAWDNILKPIFKALMFYVDNILVPAWKLAFSVVGGAVKAIFNTIGDLWTKSLKPIFNGILDFISGVFTGNWTKAWSGIVSIFKGIWEGMKTIAKAPINFIIGGLNGFINGINKIKIPDWVPGLGGKGINIPNIPSFSVGTRFLPRDMLIQAHAGEMIIPKSENPYANSNGKILPDAGGLTVTIEKFINNREQDVEAFAQELEFYRKQQALGGRG